jgi:hypothetical protein
MGILIGEINHFYGAGLIAIRILPRNHEPLV